MIVARLMHNNTCITIRYNSKVVRLKQTLCPTSLFIISYRGVGTRLSSSEGRGVKATKLSRMYFHVEALCAKTE